MPNSLRVLLAPLEPLISGPSQRLADGARVCFAPFGSGTSRATPDRAVPAKLTFLAAVADRVRGDVQWQERRIATLEGEIHLMGSAHAPVFVGAKDEYDQPKGLVPEQDAFAVSGNPKRYESLRVLRFQFPREYFQDVGDPLQGTCELPLRIDAGRFRYLEVRVQLEVDGGVEAPATANDVLDVLVTPQNPPTYGPGVKIQYVRDDRTPVRGARAVLYNENDNRIGPALLTDEEGVATWSGLESEKYFVELESRDGHLKTEVPVVNTTGSPVHVLTPMIRQGGRLWLQYVRGEQTPVPDAVARLFDASQKPVAETLVTDASGIVLWEALPSGEYLVEFDAPGAHVRTRLPPEPLHRKSPIHVVTPV